MPGKVKVAKLADVPAGRGLTVQVEGRALALFRIGANVHAIENTCRHRGGPLAEGVLNDKVVACPWHGWRFDVTSGADLTNPAAPVGSFPVSIEGEDVYVTV